MESCPRAGGVCHAWARVHTEGIAEAHERAFFHTLAVLSKSHCSDQRSLKLVVESSFWRRRSSKRLSPPSAVRAACLS